LAFIVLIVAHSHSVYFWISGWTYTYKFIKFKKFYRP